MKAPTQVYKPSNFWSEVQRIVSLTTGFFSPFLQAYVDADGNTYKIDYEDRTVQVN